MYWRLAEATRIILDARQGKIVAFPAVRALLEQVDRQIPQSPALAIAKAELAELEGDNAAAINHYKEACRLDKSNPAIVLELVNLLKQQRRYSEIEELLKEADLGHSGNLQLLAAESSLQNNDPEQALEHIRQSLRSNTGNYLNHLRLAQLELMQGKGDQAAKSLEKAIELEPGRAESWIVKAAFLAQTGREAEIPEVMERLKRELPPEEIAFGPGPSQ